MLRTFGLALSLAIFWMLLSGYWIPLIVALGLASIVLCTWIAKRLDVADHEGYPIQVTPRYVSYFPWLMKEIVVSNITVAVAILKGSTAIKPQVIEVPAEQSSDLGITVYANSITLTPGTVTVAVDNSVITVHALMDETAEGLKSGEMSARVCTLMGEERAAAEETST